jgi:hypothetical protein
MTLLHPGEKFPNLAVNPTDGPHCSCPTYGDCGEILALSAWEGNS